ncbi:MAG: hypothetical protein LJE70_18090 [Chromatiaceae bacterium]|jgi:hypothetical protein|nr:hypothetical protein [Chromatiaceae bacterium]
MIAIYRPPPGGIILFLLPLILLGIHYGFEVYLADSCLDRGGSFNYDDWVCSVTDTFEHTPYLRRHWGKVAIASSFSLSGLIVLALHFFKKR